MSSDFETVKSLFKKSEPRPGLLGIEKLGIIYAVFTAAVAVVFWSDIPAPWSLMLTRAGFLAGMAALVAVYIWRPCRLTFFARVALQLGMLAAWYPETYVFSRMFGNFDHVFAEADQAIFGCQPALAFSDTMSGGIWCELFNLGYFSYYPMIFFLVVWVFLFKYHRYEKTTFIVLCSFFIFYTVFMFLPVAGPQYYFEAVGVERIRHGAFPEVGHYFSHNLAMLPPPGDGGFFQSLVRAAQDSGERPTAAFPSSHVGISTILMILAWKADRGRRLFVGMLPFYILLCLSTVYIRAHYAIDAIAGVAVAFPIYRLAHKLYYRRTFHRPRGYHT